MKGKNKEYIKGFKHGIAWACKMMDICTIQIQKFDSKKAIKSLKEGK
jgi:hypothetical protein